MDITYSKHMYPYKTLKNCTIFADVYRTLNDVVQPVIIWLHGGALIGGSRASIKEEQVELYLQAGYTVISIDYRLAPEAKLEEIVEDFKDAYHWIRFQIPTLYPVDSNRIAVIGHSAGGYLVLMAGFCVEPAPTVLISFYGYGDITGAWYCQPDSFYCQRPSVSKETAYKLIGDTMISEDPLSTRLDFYVYCRQNGLWPKEVSGHDPVVDHDWFEHFCPVKNITSDYPPTLLVHGDKDTDVPYTQSVLMKNELARHGVDCEFIPMPDYGHGFDKVGFTDPIVYRTFERVVAFLKKYTCI